MLGEGLREKRGEKCVFYVVGRICSLQDSRRRNFTRLGKFRLGAFWVNSAPTYFTASVKISYLAL